MLNKSCARNTKETAVRYIIIGLFKTIDREKILKTAKRENTY